MTTPAADITSTPPLTHCDREPIHIPGSVQSHGILVAIDPRTGMIRTVSESVRQLGFESRDVLGQPLSILTGQAFLAVLLQLSNTQENQFGNPLTAHLLRRDGSMPQTYDVIAHWSRGQIIAEFERPRSSEDLATAGAIDPYFQLVQRPLTQMNDSDSVAQIGTRIADSVRTFTGFERVMIYRFLEGGHGRVIAESADGGADSYLDLHFPAADIPQQARELYLRNWLRLIVDVASAPSPLVSLDAGPLDLSGSVLRSVSPIHLEYLRNMNVGASMSISIVINNQLWGLIACHHSTPLQVPYKMRSACELLGAVLGPHMQLRESATEARELATRRQKLSRLIDKLSRYSTAEQGVRALSQEICDCFDADGLAFVEREHWYGFGVTPGDDASRSLAELLPVESTSPVFFTDTLEQFARGLPIGDIAGTLLLQFEREFSLLLFRSQFTHSVSWAGNPDKAVEQPGQRLSPRTSFAAWTQELTGRSQPWSENLRKIAIEFQLALSTFTLRRLDELRTLNRSLDAKTREMEQFLYTVSHDLRSPLVTVRGFVGMLKEDIVLQDQPAIAGDIEQIANSTAVMSAILDDLLELSRVGRNLAMESKLDAGEIAQRVISRLVPRTRELNATVAIEGTLPRILADATCLDRVYENLITNALRYGLTESSRRIELGARELTHEHQLYVRDFGNGIAERYHAKIFRLFERLDKRAEGTGIGLTSVDKIMGLHHGRVWVESAPGAGATFWLSFPKRNKDTST